MTELKDNAAFVQIAIFHKDKHFLFTARSLKEDFIRRIMTFRQEVTRLSCDGKADSKL